MGEWTSKRSGDWCVTFFMTGRGEVYFGNLSRAEALATAAHAKGDAVFEVTERPSITPWDSEEEVEASVVLINPAHVTYVRVKKQLPF